MSSPLILNVVNHGITENGLLIADEDELLIREMHERIKALPTQSGELLQKLFEEIRKAEDRRIVAYRARIGSRVPQEVCCELERHLRPDAVVASEANVAQFNTLCRESEVILLSNYSYSNCEERRRKYNCLPPLHKLEFRKCEDLFIRVLRFAKYVRIYDKQIGKGGNMDGFLRGISFILRLWRDYGYFASREDCHVQIYTCEKEKVNPNFVDPGTMRENKDAVAKINAKLVSKLKRSFNWPIRLVVKHDPDQDFHARYLQTQSAILWMDRGFDFLNWDGETMTIKQTEIVLRPKASDHLRDYRNLQDSLCQ